MKPKEGAVLLMEKLKEERSLRSWHANVSEARMFTHADTSTRPLEFHCSTGAWPMKGRLQSFEWDLSASIAKFVRSVESCRRFSTPLLNHTFFVGVSSGNFTFLFREVNVTSSVG
jgi:hypothetical protein